MTPTRPVLQYHGGKWMLAPWIISRFPPHQVYVEPYGGAASVLLRKPRSYAEVYNDLDGDVVNLFRVLRNPEQAQELERLLGLTPFAREEFRFAYESTHEPVERARRLVFRSFAGHAGGATHGRNVGFRADARRRGTTPSHDWMSFPKQIKFFAQRLQGVVVESQPALHIIGRYDSTETLFYVDPPYPKATRGNGSDDYRHEMSDQEHRELAEALHSLRGMVVLSGYPCALYDEELYPDWRRVEREALADGARKRTEVLWLNPAADAARLPLFAQGAD